MQNYVISLKAENSRRGHIENEFSKQNIPFEFFDAITPNEAKVKAEALKLVVNQQFLTLGELACFMSHVSLWQKVVEENLPYIAVFEDDIFLGNNAQVYLTDLSWMPDDWFLLKMEAFCPRVMLGKSVSTLIGERSFFELKGLNLGRAGYVVSYLGAKALLKFITEASHLIALDHMMFDCFLKQNGNVFQMVPALCIQELELNKQTKQVSVLTSKLIIERNQRMKKYKPHNLSKLKRESLRLYYQLKNFIFAKPVVFK
ncbi:glycosyltransferase family 25 protein [Acinetobacter boissieri]|uniref:Glycosyl transferase, family 25 n=1 Tax=Acinetobacter boissieri TaxID=1219383 RepID=A0A1G6GG83_9GAMM|nr:glycosyltransferase family 25 protein [Acinetobacter boissieri]SDB80899.1 glycosyl transferase, family 25 [Acinetobacter boissieri]